jgi:3-deoxy-D-manno-octulosonic-acid transferase
MPFKSKAQRRKFAELLVNGKISDQTYEEWNRSTGRKELPERVTPKSGARAKKKTTAKKVAKKKPTARRKG